MFWRFGFNASTIDSLLDKDEVSLEAILDEDDLLQECKAQNTRLIDYFQRVDVLQRLLGYVTGQIESERGQFKYPHAATEVLCSEIWSIVETCINEQTLLLVPFWESVLDRSPEDMKTQMLMASRFAKVNAIFLSKKPAEMLAFIQSQPSVVDRLLRHIENPSFVDLLVRMIQMDEQPGGSGVLEWLSSQHLMARLIDFLSPQHPPDIHQVSAELIKGIIALATPSPGEGLQNGPASNQFARELASKESVTKLTSYILRDFGPDRNVAPEDITDEATPTSSENEILPTFESSTSSVVHSLGVVIELIRKNNSDYFEPYLFHTLRNRLIQVQQQLHGQTDGGRDSLERAMKEMVDRMGVVHLGAVLETMCENLESLAGYLRTPRSAKGPADTTVGKVIPLTFERFRICELFAELLHCSNMAILNRPAEFDHLYDSEGRLQGGLSSLEELARVIAMNSGDDGDNEDMDETVDEIHHAHELPVTSSTSNDSPSLIDSDEDMSDDDTEPGSSDDDAMEEIIMHEEPPAQPTSTSSLSTEIPIQDPPIVPSSPDAASLPPPSEIASQASGLSRSGSGSSRRNSNDSSLTAANQSSQVSRRSSRRMTTSLDPTTAPIFIGEKMKLRLLQVNMLSTILDLFFEYPWNNFLHSGVYDVIHQILTGHLDSGYNRELAISLFRDARLMYRIVDMQNHNDVESSKPKGVRLGYMGHLTLISEDVIIALERFPPELRLIIGQYAPTPAWDDYVTGRYDETKKRDTSLLGGGKPVVAPGARRAAGKWKVDEEDPNTLTIAPGAAAAAGEENGTANGQEVRGEFRRAGSARPTREGSADFGPAPMEDDEEDEDDDHDAAPHFAHYLANEMSSSGNFGGSESDDEDEEGGGWLSRSQFTLGNPPVTARHHSVERRPLSSAGFEDAFDPGTSSTADPFGSSEDDGFGPFSDASAVDADPFTFSASFSDEIEGDSFQSSFGDFGDFQSASGSSPLEDGELTPTTGSWTLASTSSLASDDTSGSSPGSGSSSSTGSYATADPGSPLER